MNPSKVKLSEEIEKVQKRATKILPGLRNLSYTELLPKLLTLVCRRARGDMIEVYKIVHGYHDSECEPCLQPSLYHNTRGHNRKLFKLNSHLELRRHCFAVRVVPNWNLLPSDVRSRVDLTNTDHLQSFVTTTRPSLKADTIFSWKYYDLDTRTLWYQSMSMNGIICQR